ncbi:3-dehydroquinate dehydratase [Anaeromicropila populeti]|uniref:3-dehydroquinate dehydratase n=2 Tax=Anaeromicropila populeti TaxID=37658 RepID=A0A1I6JSP7_9FIRM|nr:3-dehydroquinate dehydratase [Anaeromicropila populeti]
MVKNVAIGEGIPKICASVTGAVREDILKETRNMLQAPVNLVEWRVDFFEAHKESDRVKEMLCEMRKILGDIPLLFTFRSKNEGGEADLPFDQYAQLNLTVAEEKLADLIDVELFYKEDQIPGLVKEIQKRGTLVVMSNHDFHKTPEKEEIILRLMKMQQLGADILKIAVMPQDEKDVLTLLEATNEMRRLEQPVVTMSMGKTGSVSRIAGEVFGSAITFGTVGKASAPGQIPAHALKEVLGLLHG